MTASLFPTITGDIAKRYTGIGRMTPNGVRAQIRAAIARTLLLQGSSVVEQAAHNRHVVGSTPAPASTLDGLVLPREEVGQMSPVGRPCRTKECREALIGNGHSSASGAASRARDAEVSPVGAHHSVNRDSLHGWPSNYSQEVRHALTTQHDPAPKCSGVGSHDAATFPLSRGSTEQYVSGGLSAGAGAKEIESVGAALLRPGADECVTNKTHTDRSMASSTNSGAECQAPETIFTAAGSLAGERSAGDRREIVGNVTFNSAEAGGGDSLSIGSRHETHPSPLGEELDAPQGREERLIQSSS